MRIDARNGEVNWLVYDAEACRMLRDVVFVDDDTNEYGIYTIRPKTLDMLTIQARKIVIYPERRFVIINPVDDTEQESITRAEGVMA